MDYSWIRGQPSSRDYVFNALETHSEKLLLNKKSFPMKFHFLSPQSNQFTALSSFYFVVNTDRLSFVRTKRSVLHLHPKGNFITSNRGRALWAEFGRAAHASMMLSLSDKNTCMTQVSFLRRWEICRWATCLLQHTYLYVDLDRRSQTPTLLFLHLSSLTKKTQPVTILSRNSPELSTTKGKVGFLSQRSVWTAMTSTCWVYSSNTAPSEVTTVPGYCSSNCVLSHSSVNSEARLPGPQ